MSDLISRKKLLEQIKADSEGQEGQYGDEWLFIDTINAIPAAEPKVGKWKIEIDGNGWNEWYVFNCPSCGARIKDDRGYHEWKFNYCPNCGAKMEGRE